jgi:hypothetical protein
VPGPELISGRLRAAFRDLASTIVLRQIDRLWRAEGFAPGETSLTGGERFTLWSEYEASVNWSDPDHARRVLRVYEVVMSELVDEQAFERLRVAIARDGLRYENYRILQDSSIIAPLSGYSALRDPAGIVEAFNRVSLLIEDDPGGTMAASKELIEATAKAVLDELGVAYTDREDFSALVPRAQQGLGLGAASVNAGVDGAPSIRRILGGLASIAQGIDELRNTEGGGHGRNRATRLGPRHARLAFNGARAWCEIALDTLADVNAPWRRRNADSPPT